MLRVIQVQIEPLPTTSTNHILHNKVYRRIFLRQCLIKYIKIHHLQQTLDFSCPQVK
jgi:hypothetical protein